MYIGTSTGHITSRRALKSTKSPSVQQLFSSPGTDLPSPTSIIPEAQLPAVGETITAKVVHVKSMSHFYIQRPNLQLQSELSKLKSVKTKRRNKLKVGAACLAHFHGDQGYHRVSVVSMSPRNEVKVYYVDFGNSLDLSADEVFPLPMELAKIPALAFPCSLVGGSKEYPENLLPFFSELVVDKPLSVTVKVS